MPGENNFFHHIVIIYVKLVNNCKALIGEIGLSVCMLPKTLCENKYLYLEKIYYTEERMQSK